MNNTRRSSMMVRLVAVLAVVMMFTMCFVGGTFAKYTSSATGTDSAAVAKWSIEVNDTDIAKIHSITFDLFDTIKDSNGTDNETDMNPVDGSIIAPGTQGSFSLTIENESEVKATYKVEFSVANLYDIPVEFSIDGTNWADDITSLNPTATLNAKNGSTVDCNTVNVQWRWVYERGNDVSDTALGIAGHDAVLTVTATVTATQVD